MTALAHRPALKLVETAAAAEAEWEWFCGHCASPSPCGEPPAPHARVCPTCGLGLLLEARADAVPSNLDPFLVVDSALRIQAVSRRAEMLLGLEEADAVNRPISNLLVPADAEAEAPARFAAAIAETIPGGEAVNAFVRPWNTFGVRLRAKISSCGPPRAALLVLENAPRHLRSI